MKTKILLLVAVSFCSLASNAQITAGRYLAGGSISVSSTRFKQLDQDAKNESFGIYLQSGKVVKENTVVGVILSYGHSSYHDLSSPDSNYNKSNQYTAGLFYRKYKKLAKNFFFFGEGDAVYSHTDNTLGYPVQSGNITSKVVSDGGSVLFIPGISYSVCKRLMMELSMPNIAGASYSHQKTTYRPSSLPDQTINTFSLYANLNANLLSNFGIGFRFLLGK